MKKSLQVDVLILFVLFCSGWKTALYWLGMGHDGQLFIQQLTSHLVRLNIYCIINFKKNISLCVYTYID